MKLSEFIKVGLVKCSIHREGKDLARRTTSKASSLIGGSHIR